MNRPTVTERPTVAPARWDATVCAWPDDEARHWAHHLMDTAHQDAAVEAVVATGSAVRPTSGPDGPSASGTA